MLFQAAEESKVFIQCFDELWMEKVDVKMAVINYSPFKLCSLSGGRTVVAFCGRE